MTAGKDRRHYIQIQGGPQMKFNFRCDHLIPGHAPHMQHADKNGNLVYDYRNVPEHVVKTLPGYIQVRDVVAVRMVAI